MLRITAEETGEVIRFRLEGKLTGPWVTELEQLYAARKTEVRYKPLVLDLADLTGTDAAGRYLLALIQREGAVLENANPLAGLPLLRGWGEQDGRAEASQ